MMFLKAAVSAILLFSGPGNASGQGMTNAADVKRIPGTEQLVALGAEPSSTGMTDVQIAIAAEAERTPVTELLVALGAKPIYTGMTSQTTSKQTSYSAKKEVVADDSKPMTGATAQQQKEEEGGT